MSATVGHGSDSSASSVRWPRCTSARASSKVLSVVNSLTSAPTTNPDFFPERTTTPFGGFTAQRERIAASSSSTGEARVFTDW